MVSWITFEVVVILMVRFRAAEVRRFHENLIGNQHRFYADEIFDDARETGVKYEGLEVRFFEERCINFSRYNCTIFRSIDSVTDSLIRSFWGLHLTIADLNGNLGQCVQLRWDYKRLQWRPNPFPSNDYKRFG